MQHKLHEYRTSLAAGVSVERFMGRLDAVLSDASKSAALIQIVKAVRTAGGSLSVTFVLPQVPASTCNCHDELGAMSVEGLIHAELAALFKPEVRCFTIANPATFSRICMPKRGGEYTCNRCGLALGKKTRLVDLANPQLFTKKGLRRFDEVTRPDVDVDDDAIAEDDNANVGDDGEERGTKTARNDVEEEEEEERPAKRRRRLSGAENLDDSLHRATREARRVFHRMRKALRRNRVAWTLDPMDESDVDSAERAAIVGKVEQTKLQGEIDSRLRESIATVLRNESDAVVFAKQRFNHGGLMQNNIAPIIALRPMSEAYGLTCGAVHVNTYFNHPNVVAFMETLTPSGEVPTTPDAKESFFKVAASSPALDKLMRCAYQFETPFAPTKPYFRTVEEAAVAVPATATNPIASVLARLTSESTALVGTVVRAEPLPVMRSDFLVDIDVPTQVDALDLVVFTTHGGTAGFLSRFANGIDATAVVTPFGATPNFTLTMASSMPLYSTRGSHRLFGPGLAVFHLQRNKDATYAFGDTLTLRLMMHRSDKCQLAAFMQHPASASAALAGYPSQLISLPFGYQPAFQPGIPDTYVFRHFNNQSYASLREATVSASSPAAVAVVNSERLRSHVRPDLICKLAAHSSFAFFMDASAPVPVTEALLMDTPWLEQNLALELLSSKTATNLFRVHMKTDLAMSTAADKPVLTLHVVGGSFPIPVLLMNYKPYTIAFEMTRNDPADRQYQVRFKPFVPTRGQDIALLEQLLRQAAEANLQEPGDAQKLANFVSILFGPAQDYIPLNTALLVK